MSSLAPGKRIALERSLVAAITAGACSILTACATRPLVGYSTDTPPLVLVPAEQAGIIDRRARFREIYCAVLEARGRELPDYRPCEEALTRVGSEPPGAGRPVDLGQSRLGLVAVLVPGIGYECVERWLDPPGSVARHVRQFGYDHMLIKVDALSSTENNARLGRSQTGRLLFQLFAGADVPTGRATVVAPSGQPSVGLETAWSVGLRFSFDRRYYF